MKTMVAVVVTEDRHSDVGVEVFNVMDEAIAWAKSRAREYAGYNHHRITEADEELTGPMIVDGWVYNCVYSHEGDAIRVEMRPLHERGEVPA